MIFLLGGPPRVGKSIISATVTKRRGTSAVSTDSLGAVLERVLDPEAAPGLFVCDRFNGMSEADRIRTLAESTGERIELQREESRATWMAVLPFIRSEMDEGRHVLIEGVAVLPELVSQLEQFEHRALFVGNQGSHLEENIRRGSEEHAHDWMRDASDDYVRAFAVFVRQMSASIEREASECGFPYFEMGDLPFADAVERAADVLLRAE